VILLEVTIPLGFFTSRAGDVLPGPEGPICTELVKKPDLESFQPGDKPRGDVMLDRRGGGITRSHVLQVSVLRYGVAVAGGQPKRVEGQGVSRGARERGWHPVGHLGARRTPARTGDVADKAGGGQSDQKLGNLGTHKEIFEGKEAHTSAGAGGM
jgi:hypothetical protein